MALDKSVLVDLPEHGIILDTEGLSHLDAETVFFTPKPYIDTASG